MMIKHCSYLIHTGECELEGTDRQTDGTEHVFFSGCAIDIEDKSITLTVRYGCINVIPLKVHSN